MAKNTENKRIPVKWVRDAAKAAYVKQDSCCICGTTEDLELHHLHSITTLLNTWAEKAGYDIDTDEGILAVRDEFIETHKVELYDMVYTLCNTHHVKLHGVYGKAPSPASVPKQQRWIEIQKAKLSGDAPKQSLGAFGRFY
jgi:5-methylcytosine-specific restriction endonuclease McrA